MKSISILIAFFAFASSSYANPVCVKEGISLICSVPNKNDLSMSVSALNSIMVVGQNEERERLAAFVFENGQTPATDVGPYSHLYFHYSSGNESSFMELTFHLGQMGYVRNHRRISAGVYSIDVRLFTYKNAATGEVEMLSKESRITLDTNDMVVQLSRHSNDFWYQPENGEYTLNFRVR